MLKMHFASIVLSGILGTALMTGSLYLVAYLTQKRLQVIHILGTMLTGETTEDKGLSLSKFSYLVGLVVHYAIGIGFAALYALLWRPSFYVFGAWSPVLFGAAIGIVAIIVWRLYIGLHPNPPYLPLPFYLFMIGIGHILFSLGVESVLGF